ncbi:DUF4177 domain-containing protein [Roseobacter sp. YSTF-M11]|uniref:DUF4177 domain-containing protein n=1 Tax=Roseobacter insulae TaxID=2859783 RepID=A0A9X1FV16_9RHOB|nr:DUF4177 domain-containing protein [Roseobacter insulae]MBW4707852.1 DUF4177 domain-containing protein [Roseobacter insulae]
MPQYQYRVISAPTRGVKTKALKTPEDRFSHALEEVMNQMASEGWEYQRAETLPSVERSGLTSSTTNWRNVLVFRKLLQAPRAQTAPEAAPTERREPVIIPPKTPDDDASQSEGASRMLSDNGVEEASEVSGMTSSLKQLAASRNPDKPKD